MPIKIKWNHIKAWTITAEEIKNLSIKLEDLESEVTNALTESLEQWTWYKNDTYLYVVYWVDWEWEVERDTIDLLTKDDTWVQTWTKPTSLAEVEVLTYS